MADPTDPAARAITSGTDPVPDAYPMAPRKEAAMLVPEGGAGEPVYRPVSVLAVAGLVLAGLYVGFLFIEWLVAWARSTSLLMSLYWLLWPATALVVSALAWLQVQRSEGTRAGGRLAVWGMVLSGLFGLGYTAYHAAIYVALQQQAEAFTDSWIGLIRDAQLDEAFLQTLPPTERPTSKGAELHRELELRFNSTKDGSPHGPLTSFEESPIVRLLNHGGTPEAGKETQVRSTGVRTWEYKNGGYRLELGYVLTTPEREVEIKLAVHGSEGKRKQAGRQWAVLVQESGPVAELGMQPVAARFYELRGTSREFIDKWQTKLAARRMEDAFLDTQPPSRRDELRRDYHARLVLAGLSAPGFDLVAAEPLTDPELGRRLCLTGYSDFVKGSVVSAGPDVFWAEGPLQQSIPDAVKQTFERPEQLRSMHLDQSTMYLWRRVGDQVHLAHAFQMLVGGGNSEYGVAGDVVVAADARTLEEGGPAPVWQLVAVELHHGRTATGRPHSATAPTPPGPPGLQP
jgi:hypothetical protein